MLHLVADSRALLSFVTQSRRCITFDSEISDSRKSTKIVSKVSRQTHKYSHATLYLDMALHDPNVS